jgi:hypothetical protein
MSRAWSTIRKTANERGYFARQTELNGRPCYLLLDSNLQVRLCTTKAAELENAVYGL